MSKVPQLSVTLLSVRITITLSVCVVLQHCLHGNERREKHDGKSSAFFGLLPQLAIFEVDIPLWT